MTAYRRSLAVMTCLLAEQIPSSWPRPLPQARLPHDYPVAPEELVPAKETEAWGVALG